MLPLWHFRNDNAGMQLNFELSEQIRNVCLDYLTPLMEKKPKAKKLDAIFIMGMLIGYCWEEGGEIFCDSFLNVFEGE
jgi:hypothetical protein